MRVSVFRFFFVHPLLCTVVKSLFKRIFLTAVKCTEILLEMNKFSGYSQTRNKSLPQLCASVNFLYGWKLKHSSLTSSCRADDSYWLKTQLTKQLRGEGKHWNLHRSHSCWLYITFGFRSPIIQFVSVGILVEKQHFLVSAACKKVLFALIYSAKFKNGKSQNAKTPCSHRWKKKNQQSDVANEQLTLSSSRLSSLKGQFVH